MTAPRLILAAFLVVFVATCAVKVRPKHGVPIAVPDSLLVAYAACMDLTESQVKTIRETPHYRAPALADTIGRAVRGQYVWVVDTISGIWEHEWLHLVLPDVDAAHRSPRWQDAKRCGATI